MAQGWASGMDDRGWPRAALAALALAITLLSLLIGLRLLVGGAAVADPSLAKMWLATILLLVLTAATHWAAQSAPAAFGIHQPAIASGVRAAPSLALAINLAALTHLGRLAAAPTWLAGLLLIWLLWRRWPVVVADGSVHDPAPAPAEPELEPPAADPPVQDAGPVQRSERSVIEGAEVLRLWQRIELPPWERQTTVHWAFWPALAEPPEVEVEAIGESPAEARVEQLECYGCRIRVVVDEADEQPQSIELEAVATAPLASTDSSEKLCDS